MKSSLLYALAASAALSACSKTTADPAPTPVICVFPNASIVGEWDWVATKGGITGNQTYTPGSTGVATRWVFGADSTFRQYDTRQGVTTLTESTTYSLGTVRSIYSGQSARQLTISRHATGGTSTAVIFQKMLVQELGNQLVVADNNPDGFGQTYQRR